jgi:AcrR family transcriptional regulator
MERSGPRRGAARQEGGGALVETGRRQGRRKPTRSERNAEVYQRLFDAATHVVGEVGYAEASVAEITKRAGVAQGTFYNHFQSRQELLDQLLPTVGRDLLRFIEERAEKLPTEPEREEARFRAFFDFLRKVPEFLRILNEAESFAPKGYQAHFQIAVTGYVRALRRARAAGEIRDFTDPELEALAYTLMGAREYLSQHYVYSKRRVLHIPEVVISAYVKLLAKGLFAT